MVNDGRPSCRRSTLLRRVEAPRTGEVTTNQASFNGISNGVLLRSEIVVDRHSSLATKSISIVGKSASRICDILLDSQPRAFAG
jgi:hypothetical protein